MQQLTIVKIGGNIIDDEARLHSFLKDFCRLRGSKILVHGGGKLATEFGKKLGIETEYINGRRVTDKKTLQLVTMVYGGLINKTIVAYLQANSCNAIGLTGADGNIIAANKRPVKDIDYGFVGDINDGVNGVMIKSLLDAGLTPVLAPLTHDGMGTMLNTNADTIAQSVAIAMVRQMNVMLVYCFEKKGVLGNATDETSVIERIDANSFNDLLSNGIVSGGMMPKIENALIAVSKGLTRVVIGAAEDLLQLVEGKAGTQIL
ncbi:MAG: acetylglutamate kinase [Taibaiella sp.]|nr:acetylglutamate kinase [Taibaiella sp.]